MPMEVLEDLAVEKMILPNNIVKIVDVNGTRLGVGEQGESIFEFFCEFHHLGAVHKLHDRLFNESG